MMRSGRPRYVVVRRVKERSSRLLFPAYTVILVLADRLPISQTVARHRGKQGQENAFKSSLIELDLHHPPCRLFVTNQAFYLCGLLCAVQYRLLPAKSRLFGDFRPLFPRTGQNPTDAVPTPNCTGKFANIRYQ